MPLSTQQMSIQQNLQALIARPIAHRGYHNASKGIIENTASAIKAAIDNGYGIEVDVQYSKDGEAIIFHDDCIDRLTNGSGLVREMTTKQLKALSIKHSPDHIQTLPEMLKQIRGRVPVVLELKRQHPDHKHNTNHAFERAVCKAVQSYQGAFAVMSFDDQSIKAVKMINPDIACGLVSMAFQCQDDRPSEQSALTCLSLQSLWPAFRPQLFGRKVDFVAYDINALPSWPPLMTKFLFGLPLLTWTVRTDKQQQTAQKWADTIIFEET